MTAGVVANRRDRRPTGRRTSRRGCTRRPRTTSPTGCRRWCRAPARTASRTGCRGSGRPRPRTTRARRSSARPARESRRCPRAAMNRATLLWLQQLGVGAPDDGGCGHRPGIYPCAARPIACAAWPRRLRHRGDAAADVSTADDRLVWVDLEMTGPRRRHRRDRRDRVHRHRRVARTPSTTASNSSCTPTPRRSRG